MSDIGRRHFLAALGAMGASLRLRAESTGAVSGIRVGYSAITWGGNDELAF